MPMFSQKISRFKSLEEFQMEKFQIQLQLQLLKEEMEDSAIQLRQDVTMLSLKALVIPVAAKVFVKVSHMFSSDNHYEQEVDNWVSSIPSILKGIKYGLDIYSKVSNEFPKEDYYEA